MIRRYINYRLWLASRTRFFADDPTWAKDYLPAQTYREFSHHMRARWANGYNLDTFK